MFWTRLASGAVLLVIALTTMGFGGYALAGVLALISLIAFRELTKALKGGEAKGFSAPEIAGMIGAVGYYLAITFSKAEFLPLLCVVAVFMLEMFVYVFGFSKYRSEDIVAAVFAFLYAPVMLSFIYLTREHTYGLYMVWLILISAWGCDTFAYIVGMLIGKKKIFPVLSPKKSLEGCIGGVCGAALLGFLYAHFYVARVLPDANLTLPIVVICAAGAICSMVGDLAASAIKRNHGIKDYGKLIPGHGGIMDRFDSVIFTAPIVYFLMYFMF